MVEGNVTPEMIRAKLGLVPDEAIAPSVQAFMTRVLSGEYLSSRPRGDIDHRYWIRQGLDTQPFATISGAGGLMTEDEFTRCATAFCKGIQATYRKTKAAPSEIVILPRYVAGGQKTDVAHNVDYEWQGEVGDKILSVSPETDTVTMTYKAMNQFTQADRTGERKGSAHFQTALPSEDLMIVMGIEEGVHAWQARQPDFKQKEQEWLDALRTRQDAPVYKYAEKPTEVQAKPLIKAVAAGMGIALEPEQPDPVREKLGLPADEPIAPSVRAFMEKVVAGTYFKNKPYGDVDDELWPCVPKTISDHKELGMVSQHISPEHFEEFAVSFSKGVQGVFRKHGTAPLKITVMPELTDDAGKPMGAAHIVPYERMEEQAGRIRLINPRQEKSGVTVAYKFFDLYSQAKRAGTRMSSPHSATMMLPDDNVLTAGIEEALHARQARRPDYKEKTEEWLTLVHQHRVQATAPAPVNTAITLSPSGIPIPSQAAPPPAPPPPDPYEKNWAEVDARPDIHALAAEMGINMLERNPFRVYQEHDIFAEARRINATRPPPGYDKFIRPLMAREKAHPPGSPTETAVFDEMGPQTNLRIYTLALQKIGRAFHKRGDVDSLATSDSYKAVVSKRDKINAALGEIRRDLLEGWRVEGDTAVKADFQGSPEEMKDLMTAFRMVAIRSMGRDDTPQIWAVTDPAPGQPPRVPADMLRAVQGILAAHPPPVPGATRG